MDNNNPEYVENHPLFDELGERFDEEVEDACEYWHLAEKAREDGHRYLAANLYEIAEQEMHHARYLRGYLMRHGHFDEAKHGESEERYRKLLNRFDMA